MSHQITVKVSDRQIAILKNIENGLTDKEMSIIVFMSESNIRKEIYTLMSQLDCKNRAQLIGKCIRLEIL